MLGLVLSTTIYWTGLDCLHKRFSNKATLHLGRFHGYKNSTVVITNCLIVPKYQFLGWQWIFSLHCRFCISTITDNIFTGLDYMRNTVSVL